MLSEFTVTTSTVTGNKETRSESLSAKWQAGKVYLVRGEWNAEYTKAMNAFPTKGVHNDDVDASNDAYSELANGSDFNYDHV